MSKRIKWLLATAGVLALLALAAPWSLGDFVLRNEIAHRLQERTGLQTSVEGRIVLTLAPRPALKLEGVSLRDNSGALDVQTGVLRAQLRLLPLIAGRIEFTSLDLSGATISLTEPDDQRAAAIMARAAESPPLTEPPGRISLGNSTIRLVAGSRSAELFTQVDGAIEWPAAGSPATVSVAGRWRSEPFDLAMWVGDPSAMMRREASPLTLKLDSRTATASLNGRLELGLRPQFEGKAAVSIASLGEALILAGLDVHLPIPIRKISATGVLKATAQSMSLSDARISSDGNSYEGSVVLAGRDARPMLSGTLATDQLQLAPLLAGLPSLVAPDQSWSRDTLPKPVAHQLDLDLRLSASRARYGRIQVQDAGFVVKASEGQIDVSLIDSRSYGGRLKGRLVAAARPAGLGLKLTAGFTGVDAGAIAADLMRDKRIAGSATGQASLEAIGDCADELVQSLEGRIDATIENGDFIGIDLDQALRRNEKRPLSVPAEVRRGRTSFAKAQFAARIKDGVVEFDDAAATGFSLSTHVSGALRLPDRSLTMRLTASQTNIDGSPKPDAPSLSLEIAGSWDDPRLDFDFDSLIRRSNAAAPLLRAVQP